MGPDASASLVTTPVLPLPAALLVMCYLEARPGWVVEDGHSPADPDYKELVASFLGQVDQSSGGP